MKLTLNLATRTYLNRRFLYGAYAVLTTVLVLLLALNIFLFVRSWTHARQIRGHLAELEHEVRISQGEGGKVVTQADYQKLLERIAFANEILDQDNYRWTALLNRLEEVVPDNVAISGIQPNYKEKTFSLTGAAKGVGDLQLFLDNLIDSPHFSDVYLLQQSRAGSKDEGPTTISFSVAVKGGF